METILSGVEGFMYPNEMELQWSILIVLYPFITGLVAGAFILASLERVFKVEAVKPTYRLALLTALAFLLVAPLPLQLHLGHPERSFEMYLTPHTTSAMAMFGFVYLWYLMAVLLLEIWLDYRSEIVALADTTRGPMRHVYRLADARLARPQPRGAADRRAGGLHRDARRHPLGLPAARLRRLHLRLGEGEPVVVDAADADRVPVLGDGVGHRRGPAHVHADLRGCAVARSTCAASTRWRATCSTPSSSTSRWRCSISSTASTRPTSRSTRSTSWCRRGCTCADRPADRARHARAARPAGAHAAGQAERGRAPRHLRRWPAC